MPSLIVDYDYDQYDCPSCDRSFKSAKALFQHCNNTSFHSWCLDCRTAFDDDDDLRHHQLWDAAHRICDVCDEVFLNANNLRSHSIVHAKANHECVSCDRFFRSNSAMLIHLETGCQENYWDKSQTQFALMIFTKRNPTYFGIDANGSGPITCGCQGKSFSKASALCQHLESESCGIARSGASVVKIFVDMLRRAEWRWSTKARNYSVLSFEDVVDGWGNRVYG